MGIPFNKVAIFDQKCCYQSKIVAISLKLLHNSKIVAKNLKLSLTFSHVTTPTSYTPQRAIYRYVHSRNDLMDPSQPIPDAPPTCPTLPLASLHPSPPCLHQPVPAGHSWHHQARHIQPSITLPTLPTLPTRPPGPILPPRPCPAWPDPALPALPCPPRQHQPCLS